MQQRSLVKPPLDFMDAAVAANGLFIVSTLSPPSPECQPITSHFRCTPGSVPRVAGRGVVRLFQPSSSGLGIARRPTPKQRHRHPSATRSTMRPLTTIVELIRVRALLGCANSDNQSTAILLTGGRSFTDADSANSSFSLEPPATNTLDDLARTARSPALL